MGTCKESAVISPTPALWQQAQRILEILSSLNYQAGELENYLRQIALGVSQLIELDWSVVTICQDGQEKVMASSLEIGVGDHIYALHGTLTDTVVKLQQSLSVEDVRIHPEYGEPPEGYLSYLGVPLRAPQGNVIGTICSFCHQPRQFSMDEIRTAELFAERAATAIINYQLYQRQLQFNEQLEAEVAKRTAELQAAQARLIEQERLAAVGQFAAMIVHEVRNPVTTMRMGLNYFKKTVATEAAQERVALALDEADRLEELLNEILSFAKPQVLQPIVLDINSFVEEMLVILREIPVTQDRSLHFIPIQPAVKILGDKDKLKQVIINLVRNACEAIAPGEIVTCQLAPAAHPGQVSLSIHNGGAPIPSDLLPKLAQPFCSTKPDGTGLGLAIVKRIVDAHGGILSIRSTIETGTTVSLTLNQAPK